MKLTKIFTIASSILLASAISCTDVADIEDKLKSLEARIKAIENIIPSLNGNIEALQAMAGGTTIYSVDLVDGKYKITLSNGNVLYITQGSIGTANPPLLSIDAEGYWMIDYQDGYGANYILCNGSKVKAIGEDGRTPQFGVNDQGCWIVSYDGGKTWETVKDTEGNPVNSVPEDGADEYFAGVELTEDTFTITLKNGEILSIPITSGFIFTLNAPKTVEIFKPGESKAYVITSKGVASASVIACPEGFETTLTQDRLFVKATVQTKATADSRTDIAVLAISEDGYAAMGKVLVAMEGSELPEIPDNPDPDNPGTEDPEQPEDPDTPEDPAPQEGTYYAAWEKGEDIEIGGLTFNKNMFEDLAVTLVTTADMTIEGDGIYFIEPGITAALNLAGKNASRLLIIGNDPEQRSAITASSQMRISFTENEDYAVISNAAIDFSDAGNYPLNLTNNATGVFENVIFNNCAITAFAGNGNFHYNGVAGKGIENFIFKDSEFLIPEGQTTYKFIAASKGQNYSNITFDNSIVYSKAAKAVKFNIWEGYSKETVSVLDKLTITNCSFINLQINNGFIRVTDLNEIDILNNIFYTTDSSISSWQYILRAETNGPTSGTGKNNFAYIQGNDSQSYKMFYADAQMNAIGAEQFKKSPALFDTTLEAVFDLANAIFTPSKNYKQYGAQR